MSLTATVKRRARRLVGVAVASVMLAAQPTVALAATPAPEDPALVAFDALGEYAAYEALYDAYEMYEGMYYGYDYYGSDSSDDDEKEQKTEDISIAKVKFEASYPYTGGEVEPKPIVYLTLSDAYELSYIGSSFNRSSYNKILDDLKGFQYYYEHYHGTAEYDERLYDKSEDQDIDDVFEALDILTDKEKFFTYYNITDDYFDWIRSSKVILDPTDNKGFVYKLTEGDDYTLSYEKNIGPGQGTLIIKGEYPLYGKTEHYFTIGNVSQTGYERISGSTRYDTMAEIVARSFTRPTTHAVVATGQNFPDALAASSLAGAYQAPVILTESNSLSAQARTQLSNLGVTNVLLMGGTSAVSQSVETALTQMGITVTRIAGDGRVGTSLRAMETTYAGGSTSDTVIIATGYQFADSLSIGPWAYASKTPIVLTNQDGVLTDDAVRAIKNNTRITRVVIVGGTAAVSDNVRTQLGDVYAFERLAGANRYETSAKIAEWLVSSKGFTWNAPLIATGTNFPDALAGSPLAGKGKQVILLVSKTSDASVTTLVSHKDKVSTFFVLGGEGAVSKSLADSIATSLK